jgi:predicted dehydrogenase
LRDLSHELDLLQWLFGAWRRVAALGGHVSPLEIDSDDLYALLMATESCPVVSVQVSYLDRVARRRIVVNTAEHTLEADLIAATLAVDGATTKFDVERDMTYRDMHRSRLEGGPHPSSCSLAEALSTLDLIEAAERSCQGNAWVVR